MQDTKQVIGVLGTGAMGTGIAEVAAIAGHKVWMWDARPGAAKQAAEQIVDGLLKLVEKGKIAEDVPTRVSSLLCPVSTPEEMQDSGLVIEAIVEDLEIKRNLFAQMEQICSPECILASNTSSLSIAALGGTLQRPERFLGIHFFNPANRMKLVEIIPGISTRNELAEEVMQLIESWGKSCVLAKDTPGFIVNRIARPFYGEAIRIYEEGHASPAQIDDAVKRFGGFRMGPFELMDFIGHDVNFAVTESVFREFWFDPRYKPSFTQKRLVEAGRLGRKSGRGFYNYQNPETNFIPCSNEAALAILNRILVMLINEAVDALFLGIATAKDIDVAMTQGVNYPKGLLQWADEWGKDQVLETLEQLYHKYREDRYRPSPLFHTINGKFTEWTR